MLLIVGAFTALSVSGEDPWIEVAAIAIGVGTSLVLDEFALILHLEDVYWENEGRLSVEMVGLTVGCLGLVVIGASPFGVRQVGTVELGLRLGAGGVAVLHGVLVMVCVAKGKYRLAREGPRHLGHVAGFGVPADAYSRYMRTAGYDVLMVSGTDEHGTGSWPGRSGRACLQERSPTTTTGPTSRTCRRAACPTTS